MKARKWLNKYAVTFDWSATGYQLDADGWEHHAYIITLSRNGADTVTLEFRQGLAIDNPPKPRDVLSAYASDVEYGAESFEDFADTFGYDADSLRAFRTWEACKEARRKLYDFMESEAMWEDFLSIRESEES